MKRKMEKANDETKIVKINSIKDILDKEDPIELCVRCNGPTLYRKSTSIDMRNNYVEGSGQLCSDCFNLVYNIIS